MLASNESKTVSINKPKAARIETYIPNTKKKKKHLLKANKYF